MTAELKKRVITSTLLFSGLILMFYNNFFLVYFLIIIFLYSFLEFSSLINKIYFKRKQIQLTLNSIFIVYLFAYVSLFCLLNQIIEFKLLIFFCILVCISSDIGGLFCGRIFKGRKLTKISPNKTISGAVGSFIFSIFLVPIFYFSFNNFNNIFNLIFISFTISFFCQLGDLLVSYLKRRAKVKNTSNILPGHGGLLDRIDGMLLAIPIGILIWKFLITTL
jgi:phosphatidate cytidylyltransferase